LETWFVTWEGNRGKPLLYREVAREESYAFGNEYKLEYLLPEYKRPWEGARVVGGATSPIEARRKLIIAMHECEGWLGSQELMELVRGLNEE
jgi:hypothetical protein